LLTRKNVIAWVVVIALGTATAAGLMALRVDTRPSAFLPAGETTVRHFEEAARSFGADPIVVLAEFPQPGQFLERDQLPRLLELEGHLSALPDVAVVYGPATVLNQIAKSSQELLAGLSGRRDGLRAAAEQQARASGATEQAAAAEGDAAVAAFDVHYGALLVRGLPAGLPTLRNTKFTHQVVFGDSALPRPQWRWLVPEPNAIALLVRPREDLDQAATDRLVATVTDTVRGAGLGTQRLTVTGSPVVAADLANQVRRELPLLAGLAVALIAACYLAVPWVPGKRKRLLPIAATLCGIGVTLAVFGWLHRPLSLGVMAFLPILVGVGSDFPAYLIQRVHRRRVLVAALASSAGFASLMISPLPFVRDLGLALAMGVLLAVSFALVFARYLVRGADPSVSPASEAEGVGEGEHTVSVPRPLALRVTVAVCAVLVACVGWVMLPRLELQAQPEQLAAGLPAIDSAALAERLLGSTGEVQVVLDGPKMSSPEALAWMRQAEDKTILEHGSQLRPIVSLPDMVDFLGPTPTQEQIDAALTLLPGYLVRAVVTPDGTRSVISFGIKFQDLAGQQRLLDAVRAGLPPPPPHYRADLAGLPVVAARGYELISGNRYLPNVLGIVAAGLVLLVGLRRRRDAARAVAAAVLATGWGLAAFAALGIPLSPLTVALGSLTTATACEFTVLLSGARRRQSRTVGVAALAAAVGYATLAASSLMVIREFGVLLSGTVLLSLLASYVVLRVAPDRHVAPREPAEATATERAEVMT
jgi:hypothetical protein